MIKLNEYALIIFLLVRRFSSEGTTSLGMNMYHFGVSFGRSTLASHFVLLEENIVQG